MIGPTYQTWLLLTAAAAFLAGEVYGETRRHRKYLKEANALLLKELEKASTGLPLYKEIRQQRGLLNDLHRRVVAVTKALPKRPS